jgi:hypothetical protein
MTDPEVEKMLIGADYELKRAWLRSAGIEQLDEFIARCPIEAMRRDAMHERQKRALLALARPRWIDWAILLVGLVGAAAAVIQLSR